MFGFLFKSKLEPFQVVVRGNQARILYGSGTTKENPGDFNPAFFSASTLILGTRRENSAGTWNLHLSNSDFKTVQNGFLIIACERVHGGLHSREHGTAARIYFNGQQRDFIRLKDISGGHTDFFHRPPLPPFPQMWPISSCGTIYAWPLEKQHFVPGQDQEVKIELEAHVTWDIDYIALVLYRLKKELREGVKEIILVVVGAILGAIATILLGGK